MPKKDKVLSKTLGERLRELRRAKGIRSTQTLAKLMGGKYSFSNISRRETGELKIDFEYLTDLGRALKLIPKELEALMASARVNLLRPQDKMRESVLEWSKIALNAKDYQYYNADIVCSYLQTYDYMHSILSFWGSIFEDPDKSTQQRIDEANTSLINPTKKFRFLLHENVLYFPVGSPAIMIKQLERLLNFIDEPTSELRILPRGIFTPTLVYSTFYIIDSNFSFCENRLDFSISDNPTVVQYFQSDFNKLWASSVIGIRRNEIIKQAIEHYKKLK